jgi:hypothetical protein
MMFRRDNCLPEMAVKVLSIPGKNENALTADKSCCLCLAGDGGYQGCHRWGAGEGAQVSCWSFPRDHWIQDYRMKGS